MLALPVPATASRTFGTILSDTAICHFAQTWMGCAQTAMIHNMEHAIVWDGLVGFNPSGEPDAGQHAMTVLLLDDP